MIVGEPVPEEPVLLAFAQSEIFSRRWSGGLARHLTEAVAERVRYSPREEWSEADREAVLGAVRASRPPLLDPLLRLRAGWFDASMEAAALPDLYVPTAPEYRGLAPDGRLTTLVQEVEKGRDTPDAEFSGGYRRMEREFAASRWQGRPCLVASGPEGPYTVFEGLTRLGVLLARRQGGKPVPDPMPVYLGITERLADWGFACEAAIGPPPAAPGLPTAPRATDPL